MSYSIVFSNPIGNTKLLADVIKNTLGEEECIYFGKPSEEALKADIIYIGFWTNKGTCDEPIGKFIKTLTNETVFLFGSCGFGLSEDYFNKIMKSVLDKLPSEVKVINTFMCQGKMPMAVRKRYEDIYAKAPETPNIENLIKNFDMALSHPDENDFNRLREKVKEVR